MWSMGYEFIFESETGKELKYPKLKLPGSDKCIRFKSLGPGYSFDDCCKRVFRTRSSEYPFKDLEDVKEPAVVDRYMTRLNNAGFRVVITYHGMQLRSCKQRRKYREYSPELIEDIRKLDKYIKLQDFCREYRLDTVEHVEQLKTAIRADISQLAEERNVCRKQQRLWERYGVPVYVILWKQSAQEKTKAMRPLYQKLRMCDEVLKTEPAIRVNAINLVQQRVREEEKRLLMVELSKAKPTKTHVR